MASGRKGCIEEGKVKARLSGRSRSRVTESEFNRCFLIPGGADLSILGDPWTIEAFYTAWSPPPVRLGAGPSCVFPLPPGFL